MSVGADSVRLSICVVGFVDLRSENVFVFWSFCLVAFGVSGGKDRCVRGQVRLESV